MSRSPPHTAIPVGTPAAPPRTLACMEVWGGSQAFDHAVSVPGNDVRVSSTPYNGAASGGDIYYVSNCAAGTITRFFLADVSGHGTAVADIAVQLRSLMRRHINTADQTRFAVALNASFASMDLDGRFATAVLMTYFAPSHHLIICNAGHPRPLRFSARTSSWDLLDTHSPGVLSTSTNKDSPVGIANLPLGILDPTTYHQFALPLEPGDMIVVYTDALIEAPTPLGQQLGEAGLLELARELPPSELRDVPQHLRRRVLEQSGASTFDDDATIIALHHTATEPPHLTWTGQAARIARMLGLGAIDSAPHAPS
jgi:phosphoserine phosphatase RsbU/P